MNVVLPRAGIEPFSQMRIVTNGLGRAGSVRQNGCLLGGGAGAGIEPAHKVRFVNTALGVPVRERNRLGENEVLVPGAGIEPARLAAGDFESPASTNFTTRAGRSEDRNYGTVWA